MRYPSESIEQFQTSTSRRPSPVCADHENRPSNRLNRLATHDKSWLATMHPSLSAHTHRTQTPKRASAPLAATSKTQTAI